MPINLLTTQLLQTQCQGTKKAESMTPLFLSLNQDTVGWSLEVKCAVCNMKSPSDFVGLHILTLKVKFYGAVHRARYNHLLASNPYLRSEFAGRRRNRIRSAIDRRGRSTCEPCRTDPRCLPSYRGYRIELRLRVQDAALIQKTFPS